MTTQKTIVIFGATGNQGSSVANTFLAAPNWHVRAITRSPSSDRALALSQRGAEIVQADLADPSSLPPALAGVHAVFLNTTFWESYYPIKTALANEGKDVAPASEHAFDAETRMGRNLVDAVAEIPSLERFVYSALAPIAKGSNGKYTRSLHLSAKAWIVDYVGRAQPALARKTSFVYPAVYNFNHMLQPKKDPSTGRWGLVAAVKEETRVPLLDPRGSLGNFVRVLVENEKAGIKLLACEEWLTIKEILAKWSAASGQEASLMPVTTAMLHEKRGVPWELLDAVDYMVEFGYGAGADGLIQPDKLSTKVEVRSYDEWLRGRNWTEVLEA